MVFVALILSRMIYTLPACGGHLIRQLQERLDAFLKRARKFSFCYANCTTCELLYKVNARLFRFAQRPEHCLYHLLPDTIDSRSVKLRHRGHSFKYSLYKNAFISRCLFKYV